MAELKTKPTKVSAVTFIKGLEDKQIRDDGLELLKIFKAVTGKNPVMWGAAIVGFGMYHYESEKSAQKGDWPLVAFAPRKQHLTVYVMAKPKELSSLLKLLGKHKMSGSCLHIKRLAEVDKKILAKIIGESFKEMKKRYKV